MEVEGGRKRRFGRRDWRRRRRRQINWRREKKDKGLEKMNKIQEEEIAIGRGEEEGQCIGEGGGVL